MKNGHITESGTYTELMRRQGDFSDFIITYSQEDQNMQKGKKYHFHILLVYRAFFFTDHEKVIITFTDEDVVKVERKYERSLSEEVNYSSLTK